MDAARPFKNGTKVGNWELRKRLGGGGQGDVWEVRPTTTTHSPSRAMKICFAQDETSRSRFEREITLLQSISHPNIIPILDSSTAWTPATALAPEFAYYVTERFDIALDKHTDLSHAPELALRLFRELCHAIEHLHSRSPQIIHRDIKPSNVLYGSEPRRVAIADLGIALPQGAETKLTRTNEVVGTPMYRAPEVLNGHGGDARSDVYSLGRTLEYMLTGRDPDGQAGHFLGDRADMSQAVRAKLIAVLAKACAFESGARYDSVAALVNDLPDVWLDVRKAAGDSTPHEASSVALIESSTSDGYAAAVEMVKQRDAVRWRDVEKRRRSEVNSVLLDWRAAHERERPVDVAHLEGWVDDLLVRLAPHFARAAALVEFPRDRLADPFDIVGDLTLISGWNRSGLTVLVEAPSSLVCVAHNVLGAMAVSASNIDDAVAAATMSVRDRKGDFAPLWRIHELTLWPVTLNGNRHHAWSYLYSLSGRHSWVASAFGGEHEYQICLVAYWWIMSFVEFLAKIVEWRTASKSASITRLDVLPVFLVLCDEDTIIGAYRRAFRTAEVVRRVAERLRVPTDDAYAHWSRWVELMKTSVASDRDFLRDFSYLRFPELPR